MTRNKSFKGRVRARMDKTGERYATARRQLVARATAKGEPEPQGPAAQGPAGAAAEVRPPYSDDVVRANTGRAWDEWFALLDRWGAVERLYEAFADAALRERWLPGATVEVRTARPPKSIRANWDDGSTRLVIAFTARGEKKSQVALAHERVPDAATADQLKAFWRERMAALKQVLEA